MPKRCSKCQAIKQLSSFGKNSRGSQSRHSYCKQCLSMYRKEYNQKKKQQLRKYDREVHYPRTGKEYRQRRYKTRYQYTNEYKRKHPEKRRLWEQRRKAQMSKLPNTLTEKQWEAIKAKYKYKCAYCGKKRKLTMDHVIPVAKGGGLTKNNIVPSCQSCNSRKGVG